MAMLGGPQIAAANFPRGSEVAVDWIMPILERLWGSGHTRFDASEAAQNGWFDEVKNTHEGLLINTAQSWFTGYNSNVEGHEEGRVRYFVYNGGSPKYVKRINAVAESGYAGITFADASGELANSGDTRRTA